MILFFLTNETYVALKHATYDLIEFSRYCIEELGHRYNFFLGKVQMDSLEARFDQYRQLVGGQYHVSIREVYECEVKLRLHSALPVITSDDFKERLGDPSPQDDVLRMFDIDVTERDFDILSSKVPVLTYVAGYCTFAAVKALKCEDCKENLVLERTLPHDGCVHPLTIALDRGGLHFPRPFVVFVVMHTEVAVKKLLHPEHSMAFLKLCNQRKAVKDLTLLTLPYFEDLDTCMNEHTPEAVLDMILNSTNIMSDNICQSKNDELTNHARSVPVKIRKASLIAVAVECAEIGDK